MNMSTKAKRRTPRPQPKAIKQGASKLDQIATALRANKGASIPSLMKITGWQAHSVRGAMAGALKKRGLAVTSEKMGDERIYRITGKA